LIAVGLVGLMVVSVHKFDDVTAWQSTIRQDGVHARAAVVEVMDDSGKSANDRIVVRVSEPDQFSMTIDDIADIDRYTENTTIDVWFDPLHHGRIATAADVSSEGVEDWWGTVIGLLFCVFVWMALWAISTLRGIAVARRHDYRWAELSALGAKDRSRSGQRTLMQFDSSEEPWTVRWHHPTAIPSHVVVAGAGTRRLVVTDRPFVVRQAKLLWTARNWQKHLAEGSLGDAVVARP
jgi:hypothetical protein